MLDVTAVRVGNSEYARSNGSFGLSTLRDRHARFASNGTGRLYFPGKGGKVHDIPIDDPKLSSLVRKCQQLPGQHLFQYLDDEGRRHAIDSGQVNQYLQKHLGPGFSAKDFRTWHATLRAYELLLKLKQPEPPSERAFRVALNEVVCSVAAEFRNTPAVCRKSYINPLVLTAWQEGRGPFGTGRMRRGGTPSLLQLLKQSG